MAQQANLSQSTRDKNQRDNVLAQLTDMFGDSVPQEIIQSVGNANNWKCKSDSHLDLWGLVPIYFKIATRVTDKITSHLYVCPLNIQITFAYKCIFIFVLITFYHCKQTCLYFRIETKYV